MTKPIIAAVAILLGLGTLAWEVWMLRRYWRDDDPGAKHRRTETLMMRPLLMGFLGAAIMPLLTLLVLLELRNEIPPLNTLLWLLGIGLALSVFLVCYGARQIIIYDYNRLRYRPVFGNMRSYDFSEIRSMTPIAFDLLVRVGRRWVFIDAQQDWHPLYEKFRLWKIKNGIPVKKQEYKTALGRAFGEIPGGIGVLAVLTVFLSLVAAFWLVIAWMCLRDGKIGYAIVSLLIALLAAAALFLLLFSAANQEKYPRLAKIMIPNLVNRGKGNGAGKPETRPERSDDGEK